MSLFRQGLQSMLSDAFKYLDYSESCARHYLSTTARSAGRTFWVSFRELEGRGACREVGDKVYKCLVISHQGAVTSVSIECVCLHREVLSTELPTQLQCAVFMCWVCTLRRLKSDPVNGNIYWRFSFTLWCWPGHWTSGLALFQVLGRGNSNMKWLDCT